MGRRIFTRLGLVGLVLWMLLQGGYSLYQNHQEKIVETHFQKAMEYANSREFDRAFQELEAIHGMSGISEGQKGTAKALEKILQALQKSPENEAILESMNTIMEKSNILEKRLLEEAKKSAQQNYSHTLEKQRDTLLQQLQKLQQQDTSKLSPKERKNREQNKFAIMQKLSQVLEKIQKNSPSPAQGNQEQNIQTQQLIQKLQELNKINDSLLKKSQAANLRKQKLSIIRQLKSIQNSPEQNQSKDHLAKKQLLDSMERLLETQNRTRTPAKKKALQKRFNKALSTLHNLVNQDDNVLHKQSSTVKAPANQDKEKLSMGKKGKPSIDPRIAALEQDNQKLKKKNQELQAKKEADKKKNILLNLEKQAAEAFHNQNYAQSLSDFQQLENMDPSQSEYIGMQSLIQIREKNAPAAQQLLQKLKQRFPGDAMIPLLHAEFALMQNAPPQEALYQQAVLKRGIALAFYRLGNTALKRGEYANALRYYKQSRESKDFTTMEKTLQNNLFHNQGEALVFLSRFPEAKRSFQQVIQANPDYLPSYVALAQIFYREQDYSRVVPLLSEATQKDPKNFFAWSLLGNTYHRMGDSKKAKHAYNQALTIQPQNALILYNLGTQEIDLKDYPSAIKHLEQSQKIKPTYNTNAQLGIALVRSGKDLPKAQSIFHEILSSHPNDVTAQLGMTEILDGKGDYAGALAITQKILQTAPRNTEVLYKQGTILFKLGQYKDAIKTFQTLLTIENSESTHQGLAGALLADGQAEQALQEYDALLQKERNPEYLEGRANALIRLKQFAQAKAALQEIVENNKKYPAMSRVQQKITSINRLTSVSTRNN